MNIKAVWYRIVAGSLLNTIKHLEDGRARLDTVLRDRGSAMAMLQDENKSLTKQLAIQKNVVASMDNDASLAIQIIEARKQEVKDAEIRMRRTPTQEWVEAAQITANKRRISELEQETAKMGLVRDALRNEKAYTLFLEDNLECLNPGDIFNALPLEKRKEYFERTQ